MVAAFDADPGRAAAVGPACESVAAACAVADVVLNLTSADAHAAVTRECLLCGTHVWSEKPLAGTLA